MKEITEGEKIEIKFQSKDIVLKVLYYYFSFFILSMYKFISFSSLGA